MALINGNDYDHIDFTKNGVTTRHMLKDTLSRQMSGDLVKVQNEEPTSEGTKIWIKPSGDSEVQVPTYEEFEELSEKIDDADATIESLAVGAQPTVSVTEVDGHKRFSFGIPASNGIASITKTATDGVIDTYTISMTDGTSTSFSVNNSDITPESMAEAIATALQDYARIDGYYPDLTAGNADQLNSTKFVENKEPYLYRPSGGTSDVGNRKYLDAIVGVSLPWNQMVRDEASENHTDFADIVTVTDAVEDAAALKVKIEPQQDLHGYDHPWPAGGGKNLLNLGGQYTIAQAGNAVSITALERTIPAGTYTAAMTSSEAVAWQMTFTDNNGTTVGSLSSNTNNAGRQSKTGTLTDTAYNVRIYVNGATTISEIQLESGSTATDWTPYSNICPITGFDKVEVWDDPKHGGNIWWNQLVNSLNLNSEVHGITRTIVTDDKGNKCLRYTGTSTLTTNFTVVLVEESHFTVGHKFLYEIGCDLPSGCRNSFDTSGRAVIMTAQNVNQRSFGVVINNGTTVDFTAYPQVFDLTQMFGEGNEPTTVEEFRTLFPADYYPYNAGEITTVSAVNGDPYRHYSVTLPTEAGTVYGGELTVNADGSGSLVVNKAEEVYDGSETWTKVANVNSYYHQNDLFTRQLNYIGAVLCDKLKTVAHNGVIVDFSISGYRLSQYYEGQNWIYIKLDDSVDTVQKMKAWLEENPINVIYELATPITYLLTASEIRTLLGTNNIWSDTGDVALTYTGTDEHLALESGKKYLARINGTDSMLLGSAQEITAAKGTDNVFDLTKMFGTSVADYIYNQGAGYFRQWFGKTWYPYNIGELKHVEGLESHDMVGFNLFDEVWETGGIDSTGTPVSLANRIRSVHYTTVLPNTTYHCTLFDDTFVIYRYFYDADKNFISGTYFRTASSNVVTPENARYVRFWIWKSAWNDYDHPPKVCFNLSHSEARDEEYELYEKHSYPLDNTVILRGVPKVDSNGVYWDGDRYLPDGTVERRYGVVDLGTLEWEYDSTRIAMIVAGNKTPVNTAVTNPRGVPTVSCSKYLGIPNIGIYADATDKPDKTIFFYHNADIRNKRLFVKDSGYTDVNSFKSAMSGVLLVYELAEPTTEQATPYRNFQLVDDWGTEEFVTTGMIPVGHESRYPANLRDKLQHLPDAAGSNGSYLITQTDGQMTLTPFPAPPTTAGKYALRATVTNGVATFTWEATT